MPVTSTTTPVVTTPPVATGVAFGFSPRVVVESTADAVRDLLPHEAARAVVMRRGVDDDLFYWVRTNATYRVSLSGGAIKLQVKHAREHDGVDEPAWRDSARSRGSRALQELWPDEDAEPVEAVSRGMISHWSARSRRNMMYVLATLDHESWKRPELRLSMVTLTLPGDWLAVAPDGRAWKAAFARFVERWRDQFGWWQCAWKQEFQDRGAPHMHIMTRVPDQVWRSSRGERFQRWLSRVWAECVAAEDSLCQGCGASVACDCPVRDTERGRHERAGTNVDFGFRGTDPKRIAVYFLKHSAKTMDGKEYQHTVPVEWQSADQGPGRFWGVAGLERVAVAIDVECWAFDILKRELRHWHRSQRAREALSRRAHLIEGVSEATRRATLQDLRPFGMGKDRVLADPFGGGWVLANDGPALLYTLAAWLAAKDRAGP